MKELLVTIAIIYQVGICYSRSVPAFFIFGDSLVDVGNNNYLVTGAKAAFPNGIDFGCPYGTPSGRFTNGKTVTDILGQAVGLQDFTPPYLDPDTTGDVILKGVNYASSASGILNDTESFFGYQIHLDEQISNYAKTRQEIISMVGEREAKDLFKQGLYTVVIGSNDIIFGNLQQSPWDAFLDAAISRLGSQLTRLHNLDARKIIVANSPAVGCIPFVRNLSPWVKGCVDYMNQRAEKYNQRLSALLAGLNSEIQDSTFVYADIYSMLDDLLQNHVSYGFEVTDSACCYVVDRNRGGILPCGSLSQVCPDRTKYLFWDPFHLTQTAYSVIAMHMMDGGLNYMSPLNVRQLLELNS